MKRFIVPLTLFLLAWISVVIVSEIFFPDIVEKQGGLLLFASIVAAAILAFIRELLSYIGESKKFDEVEKPDSDVTDDSKIADVPWDALDQSLVRKYFELCREQPKSNKKLQNYFISLGLARKLKDNLYLTQAGVLLFCEKDKFPHTVCHTDVNIKIVDGKHQFSRDLSGPILGMFFEIKDQLVQYWQPLKIPSMRDENGRELVIVGYPEVAMIEALVNFLIHRNYSNDDIGTITISQDHIEFENPGKSIYPVDKMLNVEKPIHPIYKRNQRLIQTFRRTGLNQREGGGILRIKESLIQNGNVGIGDNLPLDIQNDNESDRFKLVMFCKQAPEIDDNIHSEHSAQQNNATLWQVFSRLIRGETRGMPNLGKTLGPWDRLTGGSLQKPSAFLLVKTEIYQQVLGPRIEIYRRTETPVGRSPLTNKVVIPDNRESPEVSKEHLTIRYEPEDNQWYIKDMDSTNGTKVNDVPLEPLINEPLSDGDEITLGRLAYGGIKFEFKIVRDDDILDTK